MAMGDGIRRILVKMAAADRAVPLGLSLVLHVLVLGMLTFSLARDPAPLTAPGEHQREPVQAQVVDSGALQAEIRRQEEAERREAERERAEEQARRERLAELERQEQAEQERLQRLERQRREQEQAEQARLEQLRVEREAAERERQAEQQRLQELAEQQRAEEERLEELRREQEAAEAARRQAEAEARLQRQIAEEEEALEAEAERQRQAEARRREELAPLLEQYKLSITQKVERNWSRPPSAQAGLECTVRVSQIPGGEVVDVAFGRCNGDDAVRRSIEVAVRRASPLPGPPAGASELFAREIEFIFRPEE